MVETVEGSGGMAFVGTSMGLNAQRVIERVDGAGGGRLSARGKTTEILGWFAMALGALVGVGTLYFSIVSLSAGFPPLAAILLFIGGVIAITLVVSGVRLWRGSEPSRLEIPHPSGATTGAGRKVADIIGWLTMVGGVLLATWSVFNVATRPKPNELDIIDLLLGLAIAVTLVVVSIRLRQRRSPWVPFLVGFAVSLGLFVQALRVAFRTFN